MKGCWTRSLVGALLAAMLAPAAGPGGSAAAAQDRQACTTLECECEAYAPSERGLQASPLTITYFGVSTLMFDDQRDRVLVDGFFSRPGPLQTLFAPVASIRRRVERGLGDGPPRVRALLVAHAHHDHALDVAAVAQRETNAVVIGTPSVVELAAARGIARERLCRNSAQERFEVGDFTVRALDTPHGPPLPFIGPIIDRPLLDPPQGPAHFTRFKDDRNLSFVVTHGERLRILVHPSAGPRDMSAFGAQIIFLGLGQVSAMSEAEAEHYFSSVLGPDTALVIPIHWDAFTSAPHRPLSHSPRFLDDVAGSFDRLCAFTNRRPGLTVLKPQMRSALVVQPTGAWRTEGRWAALCGPD